MATPVYILYRSTDRVFHHPLHRTTPADAYHFAVWCLEYIFHMRRGKCKKKQKEENIYTEHDGKNAIE